MNKERFENPVPEQPDKPEDKKMNRREFLKKAAIVGGGIAAAGAIGKYGKKAWEAMEEHDKRVEKEITYEGAAHVIDKKHISAGSMPVMVGKVPGLIPTAEEWQLVLSVEDNLIGESEEDKREVIDISKEQFDSFNVGDKLPVVYQVRGLGPLKHRESVTLKKP